MIVRVMDFVCRQFRFGVEGVLIPGACFLTSREERPRSM